MAKTLTEAEYGSFEIIYLYPQITPINHLALFFEQFEIE